MTRKHLLIVALLVALTMGLAAGLVQGGAHASAFDDVTTTTGDVTTDPPASTDDSTTTTPDATTTTTPDATTTTTPDATTTQELPAPTTTDQQQTTQSSTGNGTPAGTGSSNTGSSNTDTGGSQSGGATTSPPVAPCESTQITCGNNAATQIAVVSQTCNATSGPSVINVSVEAVNGDPLQNFTVSPTTSCVNVVALTQIVQQFCMGCTVVVIPPPTTNVTQVVNPAPVVHRALYCMPQPVERADGTWGTMVDLEAGQPLWDSTYANAVPATYTAGKGYSCPASGAAAQSSSVPMFTLTVPASFIGQTLQLCVQQSSGKAVCTSLHIDSGATVSIPVTANIKATVQSPLAKTAQKAKVKPKSKKQISKASSSFSTTLVKPKAPTKAKPKAHATKHATRKEHK